MTVEKFIEDNIDLIDQGTKESWEEIYRNHHEDDKLLGQFTETILSADIKDPAEIMGHIPRNYLRGSNIQKYSISENVTSIGSCAFCDCLSLTSVKIGDSVTSMGNRAFDGCSNLTKVNYTGTMDSWAQIFFSTTSANPTYYAKNLYINDVLVTTADITTATKISDYAFYKFKSLTSVSIPSSVTRIGELAFHSCTSLTSIEIPEGVTSIGNAAFYGCDSLTSVIIPSSITVIGRLVFYECTKLKEIRFKGTKKQAIQLGIGDSIKSKWKVGLVEKIICDDGEIELS